MDELSTLNVSRERTNMCGVWIAYDTELYALFLLIVFAQTFCIASSTVYGSYECKKKVIYIIGTHGSKCFISSDPSRNTYKLI